MKVLYLFFLALFFQSCDSQDDVIDDIVDDVNEETELYFPPIGIDTWETKPMESLGWDVDVAEELFDFLEQNSSRAFIVLHEGRIVIEKYWGKDILNNTFDSDSKWYWASAGKTLTAFLVGLAQENNFLNIEDKTSDYLGENWTSMSKDKEDLISIKHQLTMTTGMDYNVGNLDCISPNCLQYKADAGSQWYYHNGTYTLLENVVSNAAGQSYNDFTHQYLESKIGMEGSWIPLDDLNVYWSTARDAARFALLLSNNGVWEDEVVMSDMDYYHNMINPSQSLNLSYGYLTWLNGQSSIMFPGINTPINTSLAINAPADLFAGLGKNGQFIEVVPSESLVVIRMGQAPDASNVPIIFHNDMWEIISRMIN
ncbi:serine hydrolase domain-containing protein [Membranihabitans marinus]|uniref:serine hydrolase domain-containing protein n=1 Tax=Membranihabitans marinus TaxID=1227546 RepID=UPI001F3E0BC0|nr:serine hydrolase domain-containing protein [Membranihabitans marinus]